MGKVLEFKPKDSDHWAKRIGATVLTRVIPDMEVDLGMKLFDTEDEMIEAILKATEELEREEGEWG